jgi:competence protein ComEC
LLTIPITVFHFHQFPNLFLITNVVAVPLSTAILAVLLLLVIVSWWSGAAAIIGTVAYWLIKIMNGYIEWWDGFSFALSDYLTMSLLQCFLLYGVILGVCYWLLHKNKRNLQWALFLLAILFASNVYNSVYEVAKRKLVVYNISGYTAIDIVEGKRFQFIGDSSVATNPYLQNFHIKPARVHYQTDNRLTQLAYQKANSYYYAKKHIIVLGELTTIAPPPNVKPEVDVLIVTKNAGDDIPLLLQQFQVKQVVLDASNKPRTVAKWQTVCAELNIPLYNTNKNGAFVLDL